MKKLFSILATCIIITLHGFAQPLTGIKTIPGSYPSISSAIADLNSNGVGAGGVTFNVSAGLQDTLISPTAGTITATGTSVNPIVFQKAGTGTNPVIVAGTGTTTSSDGIIKLAGTDYITFDGIDITERGTNNTNTKRMEWGYALVKKNGSAPFDGCQYVTIKNCTITLSGTASSKGIYAGNHIATSTTALTITSATDATNNCRFFNNMITSCIQPVSLNGYNAPSPFTLYDQNNEIGADGGNTISNFPEGTGIYTKYQNNLKIANNNITETTGSNLNIYGIQAESASGASGQIYGNVISLKNGTSSSTVIYGISCKIGSSTGSSIVRIYNNTIQNCSYNNPRATAFYGIDLSSNPDSAYIYSNTISGNTTPGSGTFYGINSSGMPSNLLIYSNTISENQKTGPDGMMYCINASSSYLHFYNNNIFNNSIPSTTGTNPAELYGFYDNDAPTVQNIYNNTINNLSIGGSNSSSATTIKGIFSNSYGSKNIYENTIHGLSTNIGAATGIQIPHGSTVHIYKNHLYNISSGAGLPSATSVKGIDLNESYNVYIYNNWISELKTSTASYGNSIAGIYVGTSSTSGQHLLLSFNTIYLNAISSGANFGSSAFHCQNTNSSIYLDLVVKNNILVNVSVPNGNGYTVAYRRGNTFTMNYSYESDCNDFYAGTPGPNNLIYFDGTYPQQTIEDYINWVGPRDSHSFSVNPPFTNVVASPYDLHLFTSSPNLFESGGLSIISPIVIAEDFDEQARYPNPGYPDDPAHPAKAPDVGADEFAGTRLDLVPPVIEFSPLPNTTSFLPRTLTASITDDYSGIPLTGIGLPVLYWRITNGTPGTWNNVQGIPGADDQYFFTLGQGVTNTDTVQYYIAAQDLAPTPNISVNPDADPAGFSYNPPACSLLPYELAYYVVNRLCGTYTVGAGQDFETIGEAITALNTTEVTCAVTFLLTDETYPNDYSPFTLNPNAGISQANSVTFKPAPAVTPEILMYAYSALFDLKGVDYITIDGSNQEGGEDKSLTLQNTNGGGSAVILFSRDEMTGAQHNTIKNCILKGYAPADGTIGIKTSGGGHDDITVQNNEFLSMSTGVSLTGNAGEVITHGLISRNIFGSTSDTASLSSIGIETAYADTLSVSGNIIRNIRNTEGNPKGIIIGNETTNASVGNNLITGIIYTGVNGYGGKGLDINTGNPSSNLLVFNNVISNITGDGYDYFPSDAIVGIRILGSTGGVRLYYNSVNLSGNVLGNYSYNQSAAMYVGFQSTNLDIRNNIFRNSIEDLADDALAYSFYSDAPGTSYTAMNYNDYFATGNEAVFGYFGNYLWSLAEWQAATGQDENSMSEDPQYLSATDLRPSTSSPVLESGIPVAGVDTDITGTSRSSVNPSLGAYETGSASTAKTLNLSSVFLEGLYAGTGMMFQAQEAIYDEEGNILGVEPKWPDGSADHITVELHSSLWLYDPVCICDTSDYPTIIFTSADVLLSTFGTATVSIPSEHNGSYYLTIRHRNSIETTSALPVDFSVSSINYAFDELSKTYDGNMTTMVEMDETISPPLIFAGDVNYDGQVEAEDLNQVGNDVANFQFGYRATDVYGDGQIEANDLNITGNNAALFVYRHIPQY